MSFSDRDEFPSLEKHRHESENEAEAVEEEEEKEEEEDTHRLPDEWSGEVQSSAPLSVHPDRHASSSSLFLSHSSQEALKEEKFSSLRYSNHFTNIPRREMPPPQYSFPSSSLDHPSTLLSSSLENFATSSSPSPRHHEVDDEDREGSPPLSFPDGSTHLTSQGSSSMGRYDGQVPLHHVDPTPLVSDAMANPIKMPWGSNNNNRTNNNARDTTTTTSSSVPSGVTFLPSSTLPPWKRGVEEGEEHPARAASLPFSKHTDPGSIPPPPLPSSAYPMASYVPPPEELVTMGVTLEEYRRRAAEAEAEAIAQQNIKLFAPHWLISMSNVCEDTALVVDAVCCPCCLLAADVQAFLQPHRVQDPMTVNCHLPTAIGLSLVSLCTGSILGIASVEIAQNAYCCPGCACVVPVMSVVAFIIRTCIRRRYHIRGFRASPDYTFVPASRLPGGGRSVMGEEGTRSTSEGWQEQSNANARSPSMHGVVMSDPVSSSSPTILQRIGEVCGDVCCGIWCVWCVMIQNHRELVYRRGYQGKVVFSSSRAMTTYEIQ